MAHDEELAGIAAVLRGVGQQPGECMGTVLDQSGVLHFGILAEVDDGAGDALLCECLADQSETVFVPDSPRPAVDEHHQRWSIDLGYIQIEAMDLGCVGVSAVLEVASDLVGVQLLRRRRSDEQ